MYTLHIMVAFMGPRAEVRALQAGAGGAVCIYIYIYICINNNNNVIIQYIPHL